MQIEARVAEWTQLRAVGVTHNDLVILGHVRDFHSGLLALDESWQDPRNPVHLDCAGLVQRYNAPAPSTSTPARPAAERSGRSGRGSGDEHERGSSGGGGGGGGEAGERSGRRREGRSRAQSAAQPTSASTSTVRAWWPMFTPGQAREVAFPPPVPSTGRSPPSVDLTALLLQQQRTLRSILPRVLTAWEGPGRGPEAHKRHSAFRVEGGIVVGADGVVAPASLSSSAPAPSSLGPTPPMSPAGTVSEPFFSILRMGVCVYVYV